MFYVEQPEVGYEYLEAKIHDICPWVKMRKIPYPFDKSLIEKGLSIDNAFIVEFDMNAEEYEEMMDKYMWLEVMAYNTGEDWPDENSEEFKRYEEYGWLWDYFYNVNKIEK